MKIIKLTRGFETNVSDEDFEAVSKFKWCTTVKKGRFYARRRLPGTIKDGWHGQTLHRFVMGVTDPKIQVDHIDLDTLNNQRDNLRLSTQSQNSSNRAVDKRSKTGYKGVSKIKGRDTWRAYIVLNYKQKGLGWYKCPKEAAAAYDAAAIIHHKEFARLNFHQTQTPTP